MSSEDKEILQFSLKTLKHTDSSWQRPALNTNLQLSPRTAQGAKVSLNCFKRTCVFPGTWPPTWTDPQALNWSASAPESWGLQLLTFLINAFQHQSWFFTLKRKKTQTFQVIYVWVVWKGLLDQVKPPVKQRDGGVSWQNLTLINAVQLQEGPWRGPRVDRTGPIIVSDWMVSAHSLLPSCSPHYNSHHPPGQQPRLMGRTGGFWRSGGFPLTRKQLSKHLPALPVTLIKTPHTRFSSGLYSDQRQQLLLFCSILHKRTVLSFNRFNLCFCFYCCVSL